MELEDAPRSSPDAREVEPEMAQASLISLPHDTWQRIGEHVTKKWEDVLWAWIATGLGQTSHSHEVEDNKGAVPVVSDQARLIGLLRQTSNSLRHIRFDTPRVRHIYGYWQAIRHQLKPGARWGEIQLGMLNTLVGQLAQDSPDSIRKLFPPRLIPILMHWRGFPRAGNITVHTQEAWTTLWKAYTKQVLTATREGEVSECDKLPHIEGVVHPLHQWLDHWETGDLHVGHWGGGHENAMGNLQNFTLHLGAGGPGQIDRHLGGLRIFDPQRECGTCGAPLPNLEGSVNTRTRVTWNCGACQGYKGLPPTGWDPKGEWGEQLASARTTQIWGAPNLILIGDANPGDDFVWGMEGRNDMLHSGQVSRWIIPPHPLTITKKTRLILDAKHHYGENFARVLRDSYQLIIDMRPSRPKTLTPLTGISSIECARRLSDHLSQRQAKFVRVPGDRILDDDWWEQKGKASLT